MKVYFYAPMDDLKTLNDACQNIAFKIKSFGHTLLDETWANPLAQTEGSSETQSAARKSQVAIEYLRQADIVILEITFSNLVTGYLLHLALELGKPVVALYRCEHEPSFISAIKNDKLQVIDYSTRNLSDVLSEAIHCSNEMVGNRFNFYLSPLLSHYLDEIARLRKIPRAVYLRHLIEEDLSKNKHHFDAI